jgi:ubiquinone/menaquinone biosynthesis C-methylase UbiE
MDLAEYRKVSHATWERMAAGWDRRRAWMWDVSHAVGEQMVSKLDPQPGQTVLELAAGTGETGFAAAARLGDDGRLISTDFSAPMVEAARRRADDLELSNVAFQVMDAERMSLADDSVDGVLCRWGYMLMADPQAALAETRRVLRPGGRLCLSVWGPADDNPWGALSRRTLDEAGHVAAPEPGDPGIFAMSSEERIRELVTGAGFETVEIEPVRVEFRFDDFEDYWRFLYDLAGAVALVLERLSDDELAQVREGMEQKAEPWRSNGGYSMPGLARNAVAW